MRKIANTVDEALTKANKAVKAVSIYVGTASANIVPVLGQPTHLTIGDIPVRTVGQKVLHVLKGKKEFSQEIEGEKVFICAQDWPSIVNGVTGLGESSKVYLHWDQLEAYMEIWNEFTQPNMVHISQEQFLEMTCNTQWMVLLEGGVIFLERTMKDLVCSQPQDLLLFITPYNYN